MAGRRVYGEGTRLGADGLQVKGSFVFSPEGVQWTHKDSKHAEDDKIKWDAEGGGGVLMPAASRWAMCRLLGGCLWRVSSSCASRRTQETTIGSTGLRAACGEGLFCAADCGTGFRARGGVREGCV